eukprot:GEZU01010958.1.p1 GENE.GEZU01010958.1~~GEZU01010958.1.p1  ORF type:complete len:140 (-),score=34.61 GEZU01010958.1:119-538(-)
MQCQPVIINIQEPYYSLVKSGKKKVEGRLAHNEYMKLKPGDVIQARKDKKSLAEGEQQDSFYLRVVKVNKYSSFEEMLRAEGINKVLPSNSITSEQGVEVYRVFYSEEEEQKWGVAGIHVEVEKEVPSTPLDDATCFVD